VLLGCNSEWMKVKCGVPQGSVPGPLLFLIYIKGIDDSVSSKLLEFADDTKVFGVVPNINGIKKLQIDLMNLRECKCQSKFLGAFVAIATLMSHALMVV
jgi:Reverse transcriptase (RNA-dependent DNA polymerase)